MRRKRTTERMDCQAPPLLSDRIKFDTTGGKFDTGAFKVWHYLLYKVWHCPTMLIPVLKIGENKKIQSLVLSEIVTLLYGRFDLRVNTQVVLNLFR